VEARLSCLGCNQIETLPVTLPDGRVVCATCPDLGELGEKITPNYLQQPEIIALQNASKIL
jgi:hypothetical protein